MANINAASYIWNIGDRKISINVTRTYYVFYYRLGLFTGLDKYIGDI